MGEILTWDFVLNSLADNKNGLAENKVDIAELQARTFDLEMKAVPRIDAMEARLDRLERAALEQLKAATAAKAPTSRRENR